MSEPAPLSVGFILLPDFTMLALAAFVDTLRLAGDERDRSRPINCRWKVMSDDGDAVRASNGVRVYPDGPLTDLEHFDYLVVVGGTLYNGPEIGTATRAYLTRAAARNVPLVGICTGSFALARVGLMQGRRCCVSWFHKSELQIEFPDLDVVADQLFIVDRDRITCAGGTSVIHLASFLVDKHVGAGRAAKGLRVMLEERPREASSPQPLPSIAGLDAIADPRVHRAMLLIERQLTAPLPVSAIAAAVGTTTRHLNRLFRAEAGVTPSAFRDQLRLERAYPMVADGALSLTAIAFRLGFSDGSHFSRKFKKRFGISPRGARLGDNIRHTAVIAISGNDPSAS